MAEPQTISQGCLVPKFTGELCLGPENALVSRYACSPGTLRLVRGQGPVTLRPSLRLFGLRLSSPEPGPRESAEEISEALGVAVAMNAGATLIYSTRVLDAVEAKVATAKK
jgi:hypothetical protein